MTTTIGIDVGTFETKGVLVRDDGVVLARAQRTHGIRQPLPGHVEHDPEADWWADLCSIANQLCADPGCDHLAGVAVSAIGPCVVATDANLNPLRPAILYGVDQRAARQIDRLNDALGVGRVLARCGNSLTSQSAGPKIAWLHDEEPKVWSAARWFMTSQSWLVARLTGEVTMDHGTAGYFHPLYDLMARDWDISGCEEFVSLQQLPRLGWATDIAGRVTGPASAETGIPAGVPVIIGTTDSPAEAVGAGVIDEGTMMLQYGSSGYFLRVGRKPQVVDELWAAPFCLPDTSVLAAGTSTLGTVTRWLCGVLGIKDDDDTAFGRLIELAQQSPPGAKGLLMLPMLIGERTPFQDADARGVLVGLGLEHGMADIVRATLEGIGHSMAEAIGTFARHGVSIEKAVAVGGATKNPVIVAAVGAVTGLAQEVRLSGGACLGDAFLAALGSGVVASPSVIHDWLPPAQTVDPPVERQPYLRDHDDYLATYEALKAIQKRRGTGSLGA